MKHVLLLFMAMFFFLTGKAQNPFNQPRIAHDSLSCGAALTNSACNLIVNPSFHCSGASLEAFSDGDVFMWQDVNNMTTDINGALAGALGWTKPTLPTNLNLVNYSSMLVDNSDKTTEGISGRTFPLESGKKYALSFFLSSAALSNYRTDGGTYTFKIYLTHCQNFGVTSSGNPEILAEKQLIYCRSFELQGDSDWQQYFVSFTAETDYDMIVIYPEIPDDGYDGGTYVHFLYPELIPVNPVATYFDTVGSFAGKTTLTACGLMNAQYKWVGPNGFVTNELTYVIAHTGNELPTDDYIFTMWIPNATGNLPQSCSDTIAPVIEKQALETIGLLAFDCGGGPVATTGCNLIPNAGFAVINTNLPTEGAFLIENVLYWSSVNGGSPDINGIAPAYIPPVLPFPLTNINSAGMGVLDGISPPGLVYEGICAKIAPVTQFKKYAFSFFLASSGYPVNFPNGANFTFKVVLTKCQNFPTAPYLVGTTVPPAMTQKQEIFCKSMNGLQVSGWQQYFLTFTADDDYDMIVIYPEPSTTPFLGLTYLYFLMPELINVTNLVTVTQNAACNYTLQACGVTNATYAWTDGDGNLIGTSNPITVDATINPLLYSLTMSVPGLLTTQGNTCSDNVDHIDVLAFGTKATWVGGSGITLANQRDWNTATNWSPAVVPNNALTDVRIPATTYKPFIASGTFQINSIVIESGGSLINNGLLQVARNITGASQSIDNYFFDPATNTSTGVITGSIEMNGTCKAQTLAGNVFVGNDVKNFTVLNDVTISSSLGQGLDVHGQLSFCYDINCITNATNKTLITGGNLTLVSTASITANVAKIDATNFISGDVTVERHIMTGTGTTEHSKKWQALATPTGANSSGQSVYNSWMEGGITPTGYGTHIPDPSWTSTVTNGFDAHSFITSIKTYNSGTNAFDAITNTGISLYNKNGYFIFVRGDRAVTQLPDDPNPTNLRSKGSLFQPHTGYAPPTVTVPLTVPGSPTIWKFAMVGNPYASTININDMKNTGYFTNLTNNVIVWDPLLQGSQGLGSYQTLHASTGYKPTPGGTALYDATIAYSEIQSGQAFFVGTPDNSTVGSVTFAESIKSSNSRVVTRHNDVFYHKSFNANLYFGESICDGNSILFDKDYLNGIDKNDAGKMYNPGENFMITKGSSTFLSVETRRQINEKDSIFYAFK